MSESDLAYREPLISMSWDDDVNDDVNYSNMVALVL
jgi:hypothetical protein